MDSQAPAFTAWLDDFFASYYRRHPVNATFIGVHAHDGSLPNYSASGIGDALAEVETLLARLRALPHETLSEPEAIDRRLAEGQLEIERWELTSGFIHRGNPAEYTGEAAFGVMSLFLRKFAPLDRRVASAVERLEQIPVLLRHAERNVREAPLAWTNRAIDECVGILAFLDDGIDLLMQDEGIAGSGLRQAADTAARAVTHFQQYLEHDLRQKPGSTYACGPEAFDLLLRRAHALDMPASAIDDYASHAFETSLRRLEDDVTRVGARTPQEALARLADDHPSADEYYARYSEVWLAAREAAIDHRLVHWPDYPIHYAPRPRWAQTAAQHLYFLFYRAPAAFDDVDVVDYLVAPLEETLSREEQERFLRANNQSVIKLNHVVHHGGIGHHIQNWHAYRAASRIGQVAAIDCASRIAMLCGGTMAEGWACYATELMREAGFLTPLEEYSLHHARLRMAARAIVDVRLHTQRFSFDDAVAFYHDRVGMSHKAALAEVVKNSMFPGAALIYLIGTDQIHDLRRDLSMAQGDRFNLASFHDTILSYGSAPVSIIANRMRRPERDDPGAAAVPL